MASLCDDALMRNTPTLDPDVSRVRMQELTPVKEVVNQALRAGLHSNEVTPLPVTDLRVHPADSNVLVHAYTAIH
jgi:hypothetical protein